MKQYDPKLSVLVLVLGASTWCSAQSGGPWSISSSTLDGGGGRSTGGAWTLTGTIGQPDAAATKATGGSFALQGGFWPGVAPSPSIVTGDGPVLTINAAGALQVNIGWPAGAAGWQLQSATTLTNWTNQGATLTGAGSLLWPISAGAPRYFFRLKKD